MECNSLFLVGAASLLILTGCASSQEKSLAWRMAEDFSAREEWAWTNGMAWPDTNISNETVMEAGMVITASTPKGQISIRAGEGFLRFYTWDDATRSAQLWPRNERWYGSKGLYYPGPGQHWRSNHGITRGSLHEGVLWFKSTGDALAWIERTRSTGQACVYSDIGLAVAFQKLPERRQINVGVWQFMIAGQKSQSLVGSQNELISVVMTPPDR